MDSTIVAALISAVSSIVAALIGLGSSTANAPGVPGSTGTYAIPKRNRWIWLIVTTIFIAWLIFSALFIHWDVAGTSGFAIPIVVLILSVAFPIRPWSAAAISLFLFPFAFVAEPLGKLQNGLSIQNHLEPNVLGLYLGLAFGSALFAWLVTRWRVRSYRTISHDLQGPPISSAFAKEFSELAKLHQAGVLSDEEFTRAKNKLLSE